MEPASAASLPALFAQSFVIGLSIAAPVGPIGLLCIQRSLQEGPRAGLATGLGAAVADGAYGAVGAFGVAWLIAALSAARVPLAIFGAGWLGWMAWKLWRVPPAMQAATGDAGTSLLRHFASTFLLTLSNPATIFSFIAVFSALAAGAHGGMAAVDGAGTASSLPLRAPAVMVAGVFIGSATWWLALSSLVGRLRERFDLRWRRRVNLVSAAVLAAFALWQLASLLRR